MARDYVLTAPARSHLKNIGAYTRKKWGVEQQRKYLGQLFKRFEEIGESPNLGHERPEIVPGARSVVEGKHVIFYQLTDKRAVILGVVHGRMDLKTEMEKSRRHKRVRRGKKG